MACTHRALSATTPWGTLVLACTLLAVGPAAGQCAAETLAVPAQGDLQHAENLVRRFHAAPDSEARIDVARQFGDAYYRAPSDAARQRIAQMVTDLLRAQKDPRVGAALALAHSRLPFDGHTQANLQWAHHQRFITTEAYHAELAHAFSGAPEGVREAMVLEIAAGSSGYAAKIVANGIAAGDGQQFTPAAARALLAYLRRLEPVFGKDPSALGIVDLSVMQDWLVATAYLEEATGGPPRDASIVRRLGQPGTDPRAIIAYLLLPRAHALAQQPTWASPLRTLRDAALALVDRYPGASVLRQAGADIRRAMP